MKRWASDDTRGDVRAGMSFTRMHFERRPVADRSVHRLATTMSGTFSIQNAEGDSQVRADQPWKLARGPRIPRRFTIRTFRGSPCASIAVFSARA
ncbi:MAG: hypothetical protein H0T52_08370 [Lautropia sp.]|nr:hypothetical protein [Lautropia sp.]